MVGLCTAYYLVKRGRRVTVIDRGRPDGAGCSWGNAGMVVPSHFMPLASPSVLSLPLSRLFRADTVLALNPRLDWDFLRWCLRFRGACTAGRASRAAELLVQLHMASRELFGELEGDLGEFGWTRRGLLMLCRGEDALREEHHLAGKAREFGLAPEILSPAGLAELDPSGPAMDVAGGVYYPEDCCLDPGRFMERMVRRLEELGVTFLWENELLAWRREGQAVRAAVTSSGEVEAESWVAAAGFWSAPLLRKLGVRLAMEGGRGYSVTLPQPPALPRICSILVEARAAITPMGGRLRIAGGMELGARDLSINHRRADAMLRGVREAFPQFGPELFEEVPIWSGIRPCTPDGLPYLGALPSHPGVIVAAGHAMMGLSLAPVTGRMAASIVCGEAPQLDISLLDPSR